MIVHPCRALAELDYKYTALNKDKNLLDQNCSNDDDSRTEEEIAAKFKESLDDYHSSLKEDEIKTMKVDLKQ